MTLSFQEVWYVTAFRLCDRNVWVQPLLHPVSEAEQQYCDSQGWPGSGTVSTQLVLSWYQGNSILKPE